MKNTILRLIGLSLVAFYFLGCDDEEIQNPDPGHSPASIQFALDKETIKENGGEKTITISLNKPALHEGSIKVTFDTAFSKHFKTFPAHQRGMLTLDIRTGDNSISLKLISEDNSLVDGNKTVVLTLKETSENYRLGLQKTFTLTIQDDETPGQVTDSYANFISSDLSVKENNTEWHQIQTHVSESPTANGSIIFHAQSEKAVYGIHYITEPSFIDDELTLQAVPGTNTVSFKVLTLNNDFISGDLAINFTIYQTTGNIKKGSSLTEGFKIADDELEGMPKGYETSGGGWGMKKTFEYNTKGNIGRVLWETYTPYHSTDIYTYYYNDAHQLIRINTDPGHDIIYYWENARIVKQEQIRDGVIRSYSEYGYDDHGNVGSYRTFYLQPDGNFSLSDITVLLYHIDDNLYKKIVYLPTSNPDDEVIISETTFDNYLDEENPFPMVDVLPNMKTQKNLPSSYRVKTNGQDLLYNFSYEFRLDGKVGKRTAMRGNTLDVAIYHYY